MSDSSPELPPLIVKPKAACRLLNCGITHFYREVLPELDSYLDGRSRKITVDSIYRYIASQLSQAKSASEGPQPRPRGRPRKLVGGGS
jgi:hypothetical protein